MGRVNRKEKFFSNKHGLGRALIKSSKAATLNQADKGSYAHVASKLDEQSQNALKQAALGSVLMQDSLQQFMNFAKITNRQFEAERGAKTDEREVVAQVEESKEKFDRFLKDSDAGKSVPLRIPRKPQWNKELTKAELEDRENKAFLEWRRGIALMEQNFVNLSITPFQKNLEVWKQLWRALEKSDLVVQILDARNPLFYYCPDIDIYLKEMSEIKGHMLILNKADLLDDQSRKHWNNYFLKANVNHVFFSAKQEIDSWGQSKEIEQKKEEESQESSDEEQEKTFSAYNKFAKLDQSDQEQQDESNEVSEQQEPLQLKNSQIESHDLVVKEEEKVKENTEKQEIQEVKNQERFDLNSDKILTRSELLFILKRESSQRQIKLQNSKLEPVVGMVGYPNVGKSSVINALLGKKQVAVAAMPGKTRYLQTIFINPSESMPVGQDFRRLCLCDCPGLVFPSFTNSQAELVCAGVIPIDHLREFISSIDLIVQRVPKQQLEDCYKVKLPSAYSAEAFLKKVAGERGYVTGRSLPDIGKVARIVLKDYVTGKLVYCHREIEEQETLHEEEQEEQKEEELTEVTQEPRDLLHRDKYLKEKEFDEQFFFKQGKSKPKEFKMKLNKKEKREIKFAVKRGETDIEGAVQAALIRDAKKFVKGHKLKIGKEYYGAEQEIPRGKGGMDMRDF